jgi:replicative DNA helicase
MTTQVPPQDLPAEKAVLGAMLTDSAIIPDVAANLIPEDFYLPSHQKIFEAILTLHNRREAVDLITVDGFLRVSGNQISAADIASTAEQAFPAHVETHAEAVKDRSMRRKLLAILGCGIEEVYTSDDPLSIAGRLSSQLSRIGDPKGFLHISEATASILKEIDKAKECGSLVTGIPTGRKDLDERTSGIHPQDLWIFAGRPGMAKTSLMITVARGAAERGFGVAIVTAETPAPGIVRRLIAGATGIENRNLRRGKLTDLDMSAIAREAHRIYKLPIWLLEYDRRWDRIKAKIRALKAKEPSLQLVIVDYIGLLSLPRGERRAERYLELGLISGEAKDLAMDLKVGVVLLSQLNREADGKRPQLAHLRESGNLEQDADVVGLLFRPAYYDPNFRPADVCELDIAKARDGATGVVKLRFTAETVSFSDWTEPLPARDFKEAAIGAER